MVRTMVATHGWARLGTRVSRLVLKWVRHRCQLAPPKRCGDGCRGVPDERPRPPTRPR